MSRHRLDEVRPRYGRIAAAGVSLVVTAVAVLGGVGLLPAGTTTPVAGAAVSGAAGAAVGRDDGERGEAERQGSRSAPQAPVGPQAPPKDAAALVAALPGDSGSGRRVVFSESRQRVWLVEEDDRVRRTYLVSGSVYDNLDPGTYAVFSRSEQAWGIDDSGTMRWFVRFAHGPNAAIGFHDIPVDDGAKVQTPQQLGTPTSHGCIRQRTADAKAMWAFAPLGTTVVVTA